MVKVTRRAGSRFKKKVELLDGRHVKSATVRESKLCTFIDIKWKYILSI